MKTLLRHAGSFAAPVVICLLLPYLSVRAGGQTFDAVLRNTPLQFIAGCAIIGAGLVLFVLCVRMFTLIGNGTIMPWDPTRKLVTGSLYAYLRNPMILSVLIILAGEAVAFASVWIALLALLFFAINTAYFIFSEEPGLERRFGEEYREYKRNVPMWLPRFRPWKPGGQDK